MKAVHLVAFGDPSDVLQIADIPEPDAPGHDEVLIQMEYSPINYTDILLAQGDTFHPDLPLVAGDEGVGVIMAVGNPGSHLRVGDRVTIPYGTYCWAERLLAPAHDLFVVPPAVNVQQAAMLSVNPVTAVLMLDEHVKLRPGSWLAFNSANSALSKSILAVAKSRGLKTAGIVRKPEMVDGLLAAGMDVVLVDAADIVGRIKKATQEENIRLGLDGVGGESTGTLAKIMGIDSHLLIYAMRSGLPSVIDQVDLIFKRMKVHGFWMHYPLYQSKLHAAMSETTALIHSGALFVDVAATYPLGSIKAAVTHAMRGGKVLLDLKS